ncbi:CBS domain-containing protein [Alteraurantiacibacter aquimixticola]|uniref:CBS domain-containing protein n=1 Tax=Alteraurantiacibacter aquimixticola TaxID=2489173 RepID=A0A4T3EYH8_9SPHN|nr:CBS domain-containing protein [Alteraurantiacibacter aquimixticola]TIX49131.1 CBS domain-containing protein [Alteraurantiacibacter aquimixticola]
MSIARIIEGRQQDIVSCTADDSVRDVAALLAERRIGALPVMDGENVAGIFSERDLLYCVAREGEAVLSRSVGEVMTAPAISIDPGQSVLRALSLMTRRRIRHLPVVENGKLLGFVSIGDLVKYRMDQIEEEAEQMREYIAQS